MRSRAHAHFETAAVAIVLRNGKDAFVLTQDYRCGVIASFPSVQIHKGEKPVEAAVRGLREIFRLSSLSEDLKFLLSAIDPITKLKTEYFGLHYSSHMGQIMLNRGMAGDDSTIERLPRQMALIRLERSGLVLEHVKKFLYS